MSVCKNFQKKKSFSTILADTKKEHEKERIYSLESLRNFNEFVELSDFTYLLMIPSQLIRFSTQKV